MPTWPQKLEAWMQKHGHDSAKLAADLAVSERTVQRWLAGTSLPDEAARGRLVQLKAPLPPEGARPKPQTRDRLESIAEDLAEIKAQQGQILELLERLQPRAT